MRRMPARIASISCCEGTRRRRSLSTDGGAGCPPTSPPERQQYIPGHPAETRVAGMYEHHPIHDHRTGSVYRAAFGFDTVDCLEFSGGVKIPKDLSVFGAVAAQMAVVRAREHDAWNCGYGSGLSRTASRGGAF